MTRPCGSSEPVAALDNTLEVLQHEVQRKLGRCMLRLQQYELLLKTIVARVKVEGPVEELQAALTRQEASASDKSLGTLIRMFTGSCLTPEPLDAEEGPCDANSGGQSADVAWASIRVNISMSPELYAEHKAGLAELVALRNNLVHHLVERFDIADENGCRAATSSLESCYEKIDAQFQLLQTWATGFAEYQALASSYLQSKAVEDMFVHGIIPDGSVCWSRSTIVACLLEAETACQVDGWTSLDTAIARISKNNRDQMPSRYGCKSWRQVLKKSGLFELRSVAGSDGARGKALFRSCAGV